MKIERLLGIITYLLNRELVSGKHLAEKFEVSERTIQRDIESINMAGIPIISLRGSTGGYKILDSYRLSKQISTKSDLESMRMALESLSTAINHENINGTLEKVNSLHESKNTSYISVDFGVAKENKKITDYLKKIEQAIISKKQIEFVYNNANNYESLHQVEPIHLKFKWYSWYLTGYAIFKKEYRVYKLSRMTKLKQTNNDWTILHNNSIDLFEELIKNDSRKFTRLLLKCKNKAYVSFNEHFHNMELLSEDESYYYVSLDVIENERLWFALILSFGDDVEIIEPQHIKARIYNHAKKIIKISEIPDR